MKLEKIYKYTDLGEEDFNRQISFGKDAYGDFFDRKHEVTVEEGYFITKEQLEQFAKELFLDGEANKISCGTYTGCGQLYDTFAEYWQQKLKEIE